MSRIGRLPVTLPQGVAISVSPDNFVTVKGPKGELTQQMHKNVTINVEGNTVTVTRPDDNKFNRSLHGLTRALINNMVIGVSTGFEKKLDIVGVGYRAQMQGTKLVLALAYSHPVEFPQPAGITFEVPTPTKISVKGIDKQIVGEIASQIRGMRPPEPYKGKGVRYENEFVRRKEGKTGK